MTGQGLADGLEYTCSVLRRHNGLKHDWYYEKDGLWARAEAYGGEAAATAAATQAQSHSTSHAASQTSGGVDTTSAAIAATVSAATAATERAAAAATAANAAALATAKSASAQPVASSPASAQQASSTSSAAATHTTAHASTAAPVGSASAASATRPVTAESSIPRTSAASVRRPDLDSEERGAPWLLWGAGAATLALAGLFMYKGMTVEPAKKVEAQAAAVAPAATPEPKAAEEAPVAVAEAPAPAEPAAAAPEAETPPPAAEPGTTSFYGVSDSSRVMAWSSEATFNPDYTVAAAETPAEAPAADAPVAQAEPEPAAAEPDPEPYKTEPGQTSYYGIAETADATQLWAAPATVFAEAEPAPAPEPAAAEPVQAAAAEPEAEPYKTEPGVTSYYGLADKPDATQPWSAPATVFAEPEPEPAPAAEPNKTEPGVTSYYGLADKPDATQPWSAPATVFAEPVPEPAPAPAAAAVEPEPAAEPYKTEPGQTSYYGIAGQADATQPWAAPATVFAEPEPVASPAANACRDSLMAALKAGTLNFATSKWDILSDSYATLDEIAKQAKSCEGVKIEVGGHTDSTGSAAGNKTLSERRANAVMNYLIKAGVPASSITAVGYGQEKPIATNDTAAGKRQNRRIEFNVTSN